DGPHRHPSRQPRDHDRSQNRPAGQRRNAGHEAERTAHPHRDDPGGTATPMTRLRTLAAILACAAPALASYHYVHYATRNAPFNPIYEKFDLTALPNNTVTFFVSDQGPSIYAPNDNFGSVLSQIKQAAAAWNSVATSDLRVAFGGLESTTPNP